MGGHQENRGPRRRCGRPILVTSPVLASALITTLLALLAATATHAFVAPGGSAARPLSKDGPVRAGAAAFPLGASPTLTEGGGTSETSPPRPSVSEPSIENGGSGGGAGLVSVRVERTLRDATTAETITPSAARDAWIEHHWRRGGGLPIFVMDKDKDDDVSGGGGGRSMKRVVAPIMMEETLTLSDDEGGKGGGAVGLTYAVTDPGPVLGLDVVPGSHSGTVTFEPLDEDEGGDGEGRGGGGSGCRMTWDVEFETVRFRDVYQAVTEFTVGTAATTVAESVATPRLLTCRTTLDGIADVAEARDACLRFVWRDGGGLLLPPAFKYGDVVVAEEGGGDDGRGAPVRRNLLRVPPYLIETVVSTSEGVEEDESAEFVYRMQNPGWTSVPLLIHTQLGRARFVSRRESDVAGAGEVDLVWEVQIRPYPLVAAPVEWLVEMIVTTIIRNLRVHVAEPDAVVRIKPPRGGNADFPVREFGSISKATWLGGVLDAHLSDMRGTWEQTMSLPRPWTWGRTGRGDDEDVVEFGWSDGHMSE